MTPARDALSEAMASGSSGSPKLEPSDMLTTSRWSEKSPSLLGSIAQSRASVTTLVDPTQPNTRSPYSETLGATPGPMLNATKLGGGL